MKKEYKILLYAYPFIIAISILATVGVPLFDLADVAFLVLYYYILQKSFSKINIIKNADEYAAFANANADQRVQDAKATAEKMRKETEDSCAQKVQAVERELKQKRKCISQLNIEIRNLKAEIEVAQQEAVAASVAVPVDYDISSAEYKDKFALAQLMKKNVYPQTMLSLYIPTRQSLL